MMKWNFIVLMFLAALSANASESFIHVGNYNPEALLNWKVGDSADYNMTAVFGNIGTLHKEITKEEGHGVWMSETTNAMGQKDVSEVLIDRDSGKVLKFVHNGKEETYPDDTPQVISEEYTSVTVPAGTFKAMHVVAKTKQISHIEIWENMKDVVMDGSIKEIMTAQFGDITVELTQQHRTP